VAFRTRFPLGVMALALSAAACAPACAAPPKPFDPSAPAIVNLDKVLAEFRKGPGWVKYQRRMAEENRSMSTEMQTLQSVRYSTDAEKAEALAIVRKEKPSEQEQNRLKDLAKKSQGVDDEFTALSQKTAATESETKRIAEIGAMRSQAVQWLQREELKRREQLMKFEQQLGADMEDELLKAVEKVAKDRKIAHVYSHKAVLYGGQDLTDEVIKKLPK